MARLGSAYLGLAWPGSRPEAGPGTALGKVQGEVHVSWASHCLQAQLSLTSHKEEPILSPCKAIVVRKAAEWSSH
jgi:hypothetical protein